MKTKYLLLALISSIALTVFTVTTLEGKTTFTFFRGDIQSFYDYALSNEPSLKESVPIVQLHGDPHIENFGLWWTEEEGLKFGLIDFEETTTGPFYLDLERFAIGLVLVSHTRGINEDRKIIRAVFKSYSEEIFSLDSPQSSGRIDLKKSSPLVKKVWNRGKKNSRLDLLNGYGKTYINEKKERKFKTSLDLVHFDISRIKPALDIYLKFLPSKYKKKAEFYRIKDAVQVKRSGLGSFGNLKYRLLIEGPSKSQDDDYILELREAKPPALICKSDNHALRIYEAQKLIQGLTSPFLGVTQFEGRDFLVDEVYPWYSTMRAEDLKTLKDFLNLAEVGGRLLAQVHSKTAPQGDKINSDILNEREGVIVGYSYISELKTLSSRLHEAKDRWMDSLEDKYSEKALETAYKDMQSYCRDFLKKNSSFKTDVMGKLAEEVKYPYEIYYNDLYIEANRLKEQLFNITTPGTIANSYYERPSEKNFLNLKTLFDRIYQYYIGKSYSWNRYLNKYLFQKSRLERYLKEWIDSDEQYQLSPSRSNREIAEFCYNRLKEECQTNNLPWAGEVNAFYISKDFDDYYNVVLHQKRLERIRQEKGYEKEVMVLIHGLGEDRSCWKVLPELLANEDRVNSDLKKYFKVYLFRFDTIEDSKSVLNFTRELSGFIREVQKIEEVSKVNIIAHSLGGVLTLKYLTKNTDPDFDLRPSGDEMRPLLPSAALMEGFLANRYRNNIKRFIGIAPSLSGSKVANAVVAIFKKPEAWFEASVKALNTGDVPGKGDIQVEENQIGSSVNLDSFMRLDMERPLDSVNTLIIIGTPPKTTSRGKDYRGKKAFGISEDDGLVRVYSANINHNYFKDNQVKENIGYQNAELRYIPMGHFELVEITSRHHPTYKYIISFLNDKLVSQEVEKDFNIKTFGIVLRITPAIASLKVELVKDAPSGASKGIVMQEQIWNKKTGAYFEHGSFTDDSLKEAKVVYRLKAKGYKSRIISIPVTRGQLTYAPHLTLARE